MAVADPRPELIEAGQRFYDLGWMVGTGGNLSARDAEGGIWITRSGCHKGKLVDDSFLRVDAQGEVLWKAEEQHKPSAETSIHLALYAASDAIQAVYHVHTVEDTTALDFADGDRLPLPNHEMVKGLGIWREHPSVSIPLFENHHHVPDIASAIVSRFGSSLPEVPALLIRNHGITVWGTTPEETLHRLECAEFLLRLLVAQGGPRRPV